MMRLVVIRGRDTGRCIELTPHHPISIGRGSGCSFRLLDPTVSRSHCEVAMNTNAMTLRDVGSRFGTFHEGRRVAEIELQPGVRFTVGETELLIVAVNDENPTTLRPVASQSVNSHENPTFARRRPSRIGTSAEILALPGHRYLRYEVDAVLVSARTGAVFRARDRRRERNVALKLFWPHQFGDARETRRFVRAMRTAIPVRHENIVETYTAGRHRGICFLSSELVVGESAADLVARMGVCGMLDWRRVLRIGIQCARGLVAASDHGMVHRNITPRNVLIASRDDSVKLNDLVFAKAAQQIQLEQLTAPGEILGELPYLAPEQLEDEAPVDGRTDIYGLGATLYCLLTGRPPLEGRNAAETLQNIRVERPQSPSRFHLSVSPLFEGEVLRMLEKRPQDRHPDPRMLLGDLLRVAQYENVRLD
ncbi:MAG: protein kinase [Planctomycetales bacterium]|nr:protein kinase [Planctomycetales bacterium]